MSLQRYGTNLTQLWIFTIRRSKHKDLVMTQPWLTLPAGTFTDTAEESLNLAFAKIFAAMTQEDCLSRQLHRQSELHNLLLKASDWEPVSQMWTIMTARLKAAEMLEEKAPQNIALTQWQYLCQRFATWKRFSFIVCESRIPGNSMYQLSAEVAYRERHYEYWAQDRFARLEGQQMTVIANSSGEK